MLPFAQMKARAPLQDVNRLTRSGGLRFAPTSGYYLTTLRVAGALSGKSRHSQKIIAHANLCCTDRTELHACASSIIHRIRG